MWTDDHLDAMVTARQRALRQLAARNDPAHFRPIHPAWLRVRRLLPAWSTQPRAAQPQQR